MSDANWITSLAAVLRLSELGHFKPEESLSQWAEAGFLRSRAAKGLFEDKLDWVTLPAEPNALNPPWPDVPSEFWYWINKSGAGATAHFEAGIFAATVRDDLELGDHSYAERIKLANMSFHAGDLNNLLCGQTPAHTPTKFPDNRGRKPDTKRWAEFGAALAFITNIEENRNPKSQGSLYKKVADTLSASGRVPFDERTIREMLRLYISWQEAKQVDPTPEN